MDMEEKIILVLTSVGSEQQALTIAEEIMDKELAACVNILPQMRSIYRFKGKVFDDEENLLLIKTTEDNYQEVCTLISQMHTYEIPEIVGIDVDKCQSNVLSWISQNVHHEETLQKVEKS